MLEKKLIKKLGFSPKEKATDVYYKKYTNGYTIEIDFENASINYGKEIKSDSKTTQNSSMPENFVVLECVNRLLEKGYNPKNIILEKTWAAGHGTSGRLDVCITRDDGTEYLLIECKTYGKEFDKAFSRLKKDGGQLFTYFKFSNKADVIMLYASELQNNKVIYRNEIINIKDDYRTGDVKDFYEKWNKLTKDNGIFDAWVKPYNFESKALTPDGLKEIEPQDSGFIFNQFLEILRHNVVSDKPNAFNKIFTLFLCKIYDEKFCKPKQELAFQWFYTSYKYEGIENPPDNDISFQKRLTDLYKKGMKAFLEKEVTDISDADFEKKYDTLNAEIRKKLLAELTEIRLKKNNEFAIKEVFDNDSFEENAKVVKEVVELLQSYKIRYAAKQQYLSDFFELLLTTGLKQEAGQFFTPVPVAQFILKSLPLDRLVKHKLQNGMTDDMLPHIIDYAAGSGHFVTESMHEMQQLLENFDTNDLYESARKFVDKAKIAPYDWAFDYIYGIEKDYRLVKVGKVGCYLHGDGLAQVIHSDGLGNFTKTKEYKGLLRKTNKDFPKENKQFDIVVSNPPYSVSAFKNNASKYYGENDFDLYKSLTDSSSEIECLFVERTQQLLKDEGVAAVILPSSILSNEGIYTKAREIILKYFKTVAITELGSNTFMATGTNTVVLFLRRRSNYDSINLINSIERFFYDFRDITCNGIENPISKYVHHVWENINFNSYVSLLKKEPDDAITNHGIYKEYRKKIKTKNEKDFWRKVIEIEKEKLLYFILAYPQQVVLVKTGEKDAEKRFLGYEFSNRRGHEGIHPIERGKRIEDCTRLFDEENPDNPQKASTYIYRAFNGDVTSEIDASLGNNVRRVRLVDMLVFDRDKFEKTISTSVKAIKIATKWQEVQFNEIVRVIKGVTYSKQDQASEQTSIIILTADNITLDGKLEIKKEIYLRDNFNIPAEKRLVKKDIFICFSSGSKEHLGKVAFIDKDTKYYAGGFMGIIRVKPGVEPKYIYQLLNSTLRQTIRDSSSGANINNLSNLINEIKIPIPPLDIQKKFVSEIEAVEKQEKRVLIEIAQYIEKVYFLLKSDQIGLVSDLCSISTEKINPQDNPDFEYIYVGLEHIESNTGRIIKNTDFGRNILSSKNIFHVGDVLYGKLRPYLNKVAIAEFDGVCSTDILVLKTNIPKLLKYVLLSKKFVEHISELMSGVSLPRIGIQNFLNQKIPIPPLSEQQKIVAEIEKLESEIQSLQNQQEEMKSRKDQILKKYL